MYTPVSVKFLFWNINKKNNSNLILELVKQELPNIVILAESQLIDHINLETDLSTITKTKFKSRFISDQKILLFDNLNLPEHKSNEDKRTSSFLYSINGSEVLVVGVHLRDKYSVESEDLYALAGQHREIIDKSDIQKKIIVGDFNMNPFEMGVMGVTGFNAIMCAERIEHSPIRIFGLKHSTFYYNPSWEAYSLPYPNGTYHYESDTKGFNPYWHVLDQVLISSALLQSYQKNSYKIIRKIGTDDLLKTVTSRSTRVQYSIPNKELYSDHLPITFIMKI